MHKHYSIVPIAVLLTFMPSCESEFQLEPTTKTETRSRPPGPIMTATVLHDLLFDVNADNKMDYMFHSTGWTTWSYPPSTGLTVYVESFDSNQVQNSPLLGTLAMSDGTPISDTAGWKSYSESLGSSLNNSPWTGPFVKPSPRNLGFRILRQGQYYYGWVKLIVGYDGTLSIFDFAVNDTANSPILAGYHP